MRPSCASLSPQYSPSPPYAVLVAQHLLKLGAHLVTALACLHLQKLARRSSLEAGIKREKKGEEERRNVRNSV
jgi:hypothetical protein